MKVTSEVTPYGIRTVYSDERGEIVYVTYSPRSDTPAISGAPDPLPA